MKIIEIRTSNILTTKDMLIKAAIKARMQYIEMETEVLIEDYLIKIKKKEVEFPKMIDVLDFQISNDAYRKEKVFVKKDIPRLTRNNHKKQSKFVNETVKNNQYYSKRRRSQ